MNICVMLVSKACMFYLSHQSEDVLPDVSTTKLWPLFSHMSVACYLWFWYLTAERRYSAIIFLFGVCSTVSTTVL